MNAVTQRKGSSLRAEGEAIQSRHDTNTPDETTRRLHHGKQAQWYALHRRYLQSGAARLATSGRLAAGLYDALWLQASRLVRAARRHGERHRARDTDQGRVSKKETGAHRRVEPGLAGPLRGAGMRRIGRFVPRAVRHPVRRA